jgi:hypothetical protein
VDDEEYDINAFTDLQTLYNRTFSDDGEFVARATIESVEDKSPEHMVDLLYDFGSEPAFFRLDDEGNEVD